MGFPVGTVVKNLPDSAGDTVWSPSPKDPPGGGHGNLSTNLTRRIPWAEEPGGLQSMGLQRAEYNWVHTHFNLDII